MPVAGTQIRLGALQNLADSRAIIGIFLLKSLSPLKGSEFAYKLLTITSCILMKLIKDCRIGFRYCTLNPKDAVHLLSGGLGTLRELRLPTRQAYVSVHVNLCERTLFTFHLLKSDRHFFSKRNARARSIRKLGGLFLEASISWLTDCHLARQSAVTLTSPSCSKGF